MRQVRNWIFLAVFIAFFGVGVKSQNSSLTSTLRTPVERVFSRRKRWLLFPRGAQIKFTVSVSKRLLALYPRGLNFVIEAATYYPLPSARIDLIPKRLRKPTTKAPMPSGPTRLNLIGIPGSLIKYRAKPATRAPMVQRIDYNASSLQWLPPSVARIPPNPPPKWIKYHRPEYLHRYQWTPQKHQKYVEKYAKPRYPATKWHNRRTYFNKPGHWSRYGRDIELNHELHGCCDEEDTDEFVDSPHYVNYRNRRDLFGHFEGLSKILGIDMKTCIMRAMCDSKRFLMPPGYSLFHDILRIILTFPTINGLQDDYSRMMKADFETCDAFLQNKCPISLLDWLLSSKRSL
ncbi:uncharacterized protein LOC106088881 [Stomoxys calcitrans]|uniref:Uncharacterized protein n=1 Tax=Stomoxys calcitrans TaxID=35570 RepID=A0A1I8PXK7_STOCA|nr:uncharacterized protein LOC106088881 [Stomoxys calcitrans]